MAHKRTTNRSGFTLIELMISIALVLLLILGVNQIFTYTTQAVGAGQAMNAAIRDSRAIGFSLASDFAVMVPPGTGSNDSACLIIYSNAIYAFRDKNDQAGDRDGLPATVDINHNGVEGESNIPGENIPAYTYNYRNHRLDVLSFFARDLFRRQTGNLGTVVDNMSSQEAWVWYGHLWLPDNTGAYSSATYPGLGTASSNPNNLFATQFVLGRVATLLTEKSSDNSSGYIIDNAGFPQRFIDRQLQYPSGTTLASDLQPLCANAYASQAGGDSTSWWLQDARFDLAATSITNFRSKFKSYLSNTAGTAGSVGWWDQMLDGNSNTQVLQQLNAGTRFKCNPFVSKPMDAAAMAQTSPYCLGGCSQFIVEFAGDYVSQDNTLGDSKASGAKYNYGDVIQAGTDNQIDYVLVPNSNGGTRKQIMWYGLPRNTSGLGGINPVNGDVVPLNSWLAYWGISSNLDPYLAINNNGLNGTVIGAGFEKMLPTYGNGTMQPGSQYICAWGPYDKAPSMIRITLTVDDPTGRLPEGQTYQYIFTVPPQ